MDTEEIVLPKTPAGFCVQMSLLRPGSTVANTILTAIVQAGGQVVALHPLAMPREGIWQVLAIYFVPLEKSGLVPGEE